MKSIVPTVTADWRTCYLIAEVLEQARAAARAAGKTVPAELDEFVNDVAELGRLYRQNQIQKIGSEVGTSGLLSVAEAARIEGVKPRTIVKRIAGGRLPARRVGHQWAIDRADLADLRRPA